jgi:hypothetical protein
MEKSDYEFSLRALDYWMDDLEQVYKQNQDPGTEEVLLQVDKSFNNIFKLFEEQHKLALNNMSPDTLPIQRTRLSPKMLAVGNSLKRELKLDAELVQTIKDLIEVHQYRILIEAFNSVIDANTVFLNLKEADALLKLAVLEQQKAALKYPDHIKDISGFNEMDEIMFCNIKVRFSDKIIDAVNDVFGEESFEAIS